MTPVLTSLYAGPLAVLYIAISYYITVLRQRTKTNLGSGEDPLLIRMVRVHGNFAEYAPFALILVALVELGGGPAAVVHALGAGLVVSRLLHAYGLAQLEGKSFGRFWGTGLSFLVVLVAGVYASGLAVMRLMA